MAATKEISLRVRVTKDVAKRFEDCVGVESETLQFGQEVSMSSVLRQAIGEYITRWESIAASEVAREGAKVLKKAVRK